MSDYETILIEREGRVARVGAKCAIDVKSRWFFEQRNIEVWDKLIVIIIIVEDNAKYIDNNNDKNIDHHNNNDKYLDTNIENKEKNEKAEATETKQENDYQLNRAIDLLKSISVYDNLKKAS